MITISREKIALVQPNDSAKVDVKVDAKVDAKVPKKKSNSIWG